ncbi:MAG: hypothetical protein WAN04_03865 [Candidatus Udaeobacter sp.]
MKRFLALIALPVVLLIVVSVVRQCRNGHARPDYTGSDCDRHAQSRRQRAGGQPGLGEYR